MFRKDYLKRQIDLFFQELVALLSKKVVKEEKLKELASLSEKYTGETLAYFEETSAEVLIQQYGNELYKIEIISELLYHSEENTKEHFYKIKTLLTYINQKSNDFSLNRDQRFKEIEEKLNKI